MEVKDLLRLVPAPLHDAIRASSYTTKSEFIVLKAEESRKQHQNIDLCYDKLYQIVVDAGNKSLPGVTSSAQKERVIKLYGLLYSTPLLSCYSTYTD